MSKNVIVSPIDQRHDSGNPSGKFENRFANQRVDNNQGNRGNQQQGKGNQNQHQNQSKGSQNQAPPVHRTRSNDKHAIYQHVVHLKIGDEVYIVPADKDWRYDNNLIVDMRRSRSDVVPSGYIYALEGAINLVDRQENPNLCEEIDAAIEDFYTKIQTMLDYAYAYMESNEGVGKKRIRTAKSAKSSHKDDAATNAIPAWLKTALILIFAAVCVFIILMARSQGAM